MISTLARNTFGASRSSSQDGLDRQLHRKALLALCFASCAAFLAAWIFLRSVMVYYSESVECCNGRLRGWLLCFMVLQLAWPLCVHRMTCVLLCWCLGAVFLLELPGSCHRLRPLLLEAMALHAAQALLLLGASLAELTSRPLRAAAIPTGARDGTLPEVLELLAALPPESLLPEDECAICLSRFGEACTESVAELCRDEDDGDSCRDGGVRWRHLVCGHHFHESCLLRWLAQSKHCPVCRLDVNTAYRPSRGDTTKRIE